MSATDLLELNLDRYDGLKLTSKLRSGTILLTKDEVPILENKNEAETKLYHPVNAEVMWFDSTEIKTDKKSTLEHILYNKN